MSEKDQNICGAAIAVFRSVFDSLYDSSITPRMLKKLNSKLEQVKKIIEAISYIDEGVANAMNVLLKRKQEYETFNEYREKLKHLCLHINDLNIEGGSILSIRLFGLIH